MWLVDPVDADDAIERAGALGEFAGILQLLDRHNRDCEELSARLGVPHHRLPADSPELPFEAKALIDNRLWREAMLWWPAKKALIVTEALMTVPDLNVGDTGVGLHPALRLIPPRAAAEHEDAEHLLVGHGRPLHAADTGARVKRAVDHSRRDIPKLLARTPKIIKGMR